MDDLKFKGCFFTWNNKQEGGDRVFCKLDRVLCNEEWLGMFPNSVVEFLTEGIFDHSPSLLSLTGDVKIGFVPLCYFNWWKDIEEFHQQVGNDWSKPVNGNPMFRVVMKQKT